MLGLSCPSGNGTNIKMLMPCSTSWGPWDKIWKFLGSLKAPFNIIIITTAATITFVCQWMVCWSFEEEHQFSKLSYNEDNLRSYVRGSWVWEQLTGGLWGTSDFNSSPTLICEFLHLHHCPVLMVKVVCVCVSLHLDAKCMGAPASHPPLRRSLWNGIDFSRSQPRL